MTSAIGLFMIASMLAGAEAWADVQISTCHVPIEDEVASICCFTSNLPVGASIYFSKNSHHVVRISQSGKLVWVPDNSTYTFNLTTSNAGTRLIFSVELDVVYSAMNLADVWRCGFYGNQSKLILTAKQILDHHAYIRQNAASLATLTVDGTTENISSMALYRSGSPSVTLLTVDSNNNVTYRASWLKYTGEVRRNIFSVEIQNVLFAYNGTYVFEVRTMSSATMRYGVTLVVNKNPSMPMINSSSDWKLSDNKVSGSVACNSKSLSAAPLYFRPVMTIIWRLPEPDDWSPSLAKYTARVIDETVVISGVDCDKRTLPIYCTSVDGPLASASSLPFDPKSMCDALKDKKPFEGDPAYRTNIIITIVFVTTTVFILVTVAVVARRRLRVKCRRMGRKCRACCKCCAEMMPSSSDSDSDDDFDGRRGRNGVANDEQNNSVLADGLRGSDDDIGRILAQINDQQQQEQLENMNHQIANNDNIALVDQSQGIGANNEVPAMQGAVGGVELPISHLDRERQLLMEAEALLEQHHNQLNQLPIQLRIDRENIVDNVLAYYADENVALSQVNIVMVGEEGIDFGGVAFDMYTTFWYRVQEQFFVGNDRVVPHLLPHRFADESKFRLLGKILSHSVAVLKSFPISMCKSAILAMIYETTELSEETILEDFLLFLDAVDRSLVAKAVSDFSSLSDDQRTELATLFERFDYAAVVSEETFVQNLKQLARHTLCIKPKPLLEKMRSGIPISHMEFFWSNLHQDSLNVLYLALKPTADRVIARLKTEGRRNVTGRQRRVLDYLKDFLKEISPSELETFLVFVTGKKSMPRQPISIVFTTERGTLRTPRAHTCSSLMELPETYENYDALRSELKHLLASDEAQLMTMA